MIKCKTCNKMLLVNKEKMKPVYNGNNEITELKHKIKVLRKKLNDTDSKSIKEEITLYKQQNMAYQKEVIRLKSQLSQSDEIVNGHSIEGIETLAIRLSHDLKILYVNSPFCEYYSVSKSNLVQKDVSILKKIMDENLYATIKRPENGKSTTQTVKDHSDRHFEVKVTSTSKVIDIIFHDITDQQRFKKYVQRYVSEELTQYDDEDLVTFKYPERRFMTVSFTDLRDFTALTETMKPEEVRSTMNAYLEDIIHAIKSNQATIDKIVGDEVMALFGAPRYFEDHALRAIKTACDQMTNLKALQVSFARFGKHMPDCGIGINSGDMVVGNMGCTARQDYTVLGSAVNLAARLCGAAKGGEIILTQSTLKAAVQQMPKNWDAIETKSKRESDPAEMRGKTEGIYPLPKHLQGRTVYIGPGIKKNHASWQYRFDFLFSIKVKGVKTLLPVISVKSKDAKSSLALNEKRTTASTSERFFGKYRLIERVGRGGMGEVWKARDNFGNTVAIKMLIAGDAASQKQIRRFKREAEIMSRLQHRNICHIYEVGSIDQKTYIAMEYIEGVSLAHVLKYAGKNTSGRYPVVKQNQRHDFAQLLQSVKEELIIAQKNKDVKPTDRFYILNVELTLSMIIKCCEAIQYAHENGVLHRDIKPGNIMLRNNGEPILMDFGLAKLETDIQDGMSLSISGQIVGTIEYMSPEQARSSKGADEKSDVYSLGAVLYQMLAGKKHFQSSGNVLSDSNTLQTYSPPKIRESNRRVDKDLEIITLKALRSDANERYQNVEALLSDLQRYQAGINIIAKDLSTREIFQKVMARNKMVTTISLISLLSIFSFFIFSLMSWRRAVIEQDLARQEMHYAQEAEKEAQEAARNTEAALKAMAEQKLIAEQAIRKSEQAFQKMTLALESAEKEKHKAVDALKRAEIASNNLAIEKMKRENENLAMVKYSQAIEYAHQYNFDKSRQAVDESLRYKSDHLEALRLKTFLQIHEGQIQNARSMIKRILQATPDDKTLRELYHLLSIQHEIKESTFNRSLARNLFKLKQFAFIDPKDLPDQMKIKVWRGRIEQAWPGTGAKLIANQRGQWILDLSYADIQNLKPLEGIKLRSFIGKGLQIDDYSAIEDMHVTELNLSGSAISRLDTISKLPLRKLDISHTKVNDLLPINDMNLKSLDISNTQVNSLEHVVSMHLSQLSASNTPIKDLTPLSKLRGGYLRELHLDQTQITSLKGLENCMLHTLDISGCSLINDLSPLEEMKLKSLFIHNTAVKNLKPLHKMHLEKFSFTPSRHIQNISVLHDMKSLEVMGDLKDPRNLIPVKLFWKHFKYEP